MKLAKTMLFAGLLAAGGVVAQTPAPAIPSITATASCPPKPDDHPGRLASDNVRRGWFKEVQTWQTCLKKYVEEIQAQADEAVKVANAAVARSNAAVIEFNTIVKDLHAQVEVYLAEGGRRNAATMTEVRRTLDWFLACCDSQGLAYDSRQGAVAFKKSLAARGIEARTLNFHLGLVSQFLRSAVAHGYVEAKVVNGVKVAGGTGLAAHEERDAIDPAVLSVFLRTFDPTA